ncbi:bifunctional UDP-sugar hydrolase/5'-nucleotidase [uncultured Anaerococcus sp.]|uniref:bifunctional metallophosphatase/5'-nucleotidase n=1 Tax=Anaerococcus sp. AH8042_DFU013_CI05 TaxID=3385202 RepID=UPI0025D40A6C|nr:bifunctional UDP-sugar hydrolase/5'-nucleotidase [uncultured Anaerococcus sp.]
MKITILETSDMHAYISDKSFAETNKSELFSMSKIKTYIDQVRSENDFVLYIDNGDNIQGSPLGTFYHNNNDIKNLASSYNLLNPDAIVLGNHDFNYGKEYLKSYIDYLDAPVLSANTLQNDSSYLNIKPYIIKKVGNIKIGILGITTQYIPNWEKPQNIHGLSFKSAMETAEHYLPILKSEEKCDIVIVSYHGGFAKDLETGRELTPQTGENEGYDLLFSDLNFDVFLTGHTHKEIAGIYNDIVVTQPGFAGGKISEISLYIDEDKNLVDREVKLVDMAEIIPNEELEKLVEDDLVGVNEYLDQKCGQISPSALIDSVREAQIEGHPYINLINQIQMDYADCDIAAIAIYSLDAKGIPNDVTMRDIFSNYRFNNILMKIEVSGKEFKEILEYNSNYFMLDEEGCLVQNPEYFIFNYDIYSGVNYTFDYTREKGDRLISAIYKGHEITDDEKITFATNNYRAIGGGDFPVLDGTQIIWESVLEMPQLIFEYIQNKKLVKIRDLDTVNIIGFKDVK